MGADGNVRVQVGDRVVGESAKEGDGCQLRVGMGGMVGVGRVGGGRVGVGRRLLPSTRESIKLPKSNAMEISAVMIPQKT